MFAQGLDNQGLGVDAVEEGDAAGSSQCNQFHIQGQELLYLLDKKVLPSRNEKAVQGFYSQYYTLCGCLQ